MPSAVNDHSTKAPVEFVGYDLVGDVHGCYQTLLALLDKLGYGLVDGVYEFLDHERPRQLIFLGDLIDRGPGIREVLHLARAMVQRGSAIVIMGNHEYHAALYLTPDGSGGYLRRHSDHSRRIIAETLRQFSRHPKELLAFRDWMKQLPLYFQHPSFRAVHAYWDDALVDEMQHQLGSASLTPALFRQSALEPRSFAGRLMKRLTTGLTLALPDEHVIVGREGQPRKRFRVRFWGGSYSLGDAAFQPDPLPERLCNQPLAEDTRSWLDSQSYADDRRPLFIGHYWLQGAQVPQSNNIACLDYSAVLGGPLVAYRMDGESQLREDKFVAVDYCESRPS
ncbi:calcineurin-like phosphoesterase family protein [Sinobacterium caligoides]|uniref:Calcineurin-like phosphoesterase family protein n=1 Tax=Sinobacterium caligoides TaxID=933926 RepID=A0A3N2DNC6_9GAMM|nr:metallophosphoesterase [Sinobacterium caligoides]ROS01311.1 calcineurin-like phosphoesterase family protein [Sinobacterium caligoides]